MKTLRIFAVTLGFALVGAASAITSGNHSLAPAPLAPQVVSNSPAPADATMASVAKTSPSTMALPILAVLVVLASGPFVRRAFRI